jgi:ABC-type Mn2+/Zn2+ transport system ATPase subunit
MPVTPALFPFPVADPERPTRAVLRACAPKAPDWRLEKELEGLAVPPEVLARPYDTLSRGEQTKVQLAALFAREDGYALLDEPTNHLDLAGRALVAAYLARQDGFLLVSHDRDFLNRCVDHTLALNRNTIAVQRGNFDDWEREWRRQNESEQARNEQLKKDVDRHTLSARRQAEWSRRGEKGKFNVHPSETAAVDRGYVGARAAAVMKRSLAAQARTEKDIEEKKSLMKDVERVGELKLSPLEHPKKQLLRVRDAAVRYGGRTVCEGISFTVERGERVALIGRNGAGKSSVLKAVCGLSDALKGEMSPAPGLTVSYVPQSAEHLRGTLNDFISRSGADQTLFKAILRNMDFGREQFDRNIERYSEGQKKKLLLARSLCERAHLYVWDEPLKLYRRVQPHAAGGVDSALPAGHAHRGARPGVSFAGVHEGGGAGEGAGTRACRVWRGRRTIGLVAIINQRLFSISADFGRQSKQSNRQRRLKQRNLSAGGNLPRRRFPPCQAPSSCYNTAKRSGRKALLCAYFLKRFHYPESVDRTEEETDAIRLFRRAGTRIRHHQPGHARALGQLSGIAGIRGDSSRERRRVQLRQVRRGGADTALHLQPVRRARPLPVPAGRRKRRFLVGVVEAGGQPLDEYRGVCRHGTAYTAFESEYAGIHAEAAYYVPLNKTHEVWKLTVQNPGDKPRALSVFGYCEFPTKTTTSRIWSTSSTRSSSAARNSRAITFCSTSTNTGTPSRRHQRPGAVLRAGGRTGGELHREPRALSGPQTLRRARGGRGGALRRQPVLQRQPLRRAAHGADPRARRKPHAGLFAGAEDRRAGAGADRPLRRRAGGDRGCGARGAQSLLARQAGRAYVQTPDARFNAMVNTWNAFQCFTTVVWSRAASLMYCGQRNGYGYRDTVQDIQGVIHLDPALAKARLTFMLSAQVHHGAGLPLVKYTHAPGREDTPDDESYVKETGHPHYRADDALWLFPTVYKYIAETGDTAYLNEVVPYADRDEGTVLDHLKRAIDFSMTHLGPHGMPAGLHADWNDCLRLGEKGESTFVAFQLYYAMCILAELDASDAEYTVYLKTESEKLASILQDVCFEGDRFIRGFTEEGAVIGSKADREASLWLNPQSWAVISGAAAGAQADTVLQTAHDGLNTPYGLEVMHPSYRFGAFDGARMLLFNPGTKENGGVFCQPQGWAILASALAGHGERAFTYFAESSPASFNDNADLRVLEPYVHGQFIEGSESPNAGRAHVHWLTGTASTVMVGCVEGILGLRPTPEGLVVSPAIPAAWDGFTLSKKRSAAKS